LAEWPEPVERVAAFLRRAGAEARIEEFQEPTASAQDAANALGAGLNQIVKTLVFDCDGRPVAVLTPGDRRADRAKVARAAKANRAQIVGAADVERLTGFAPGAVAPFPLPGVTMALMDRSLLLQQLVWIGAGSPRHLASLPPQELLRLTRAEPADVSESPAPVAPAIETDGDR
jgi:prolyl-tRNA editing enzyme YbaK/EbsC (Cys-tRNA(Pro) deacylase)